MYTLETNILNPKDMKVWKTIFLFKSRDLHVPAVSFLLHHHLLREV